MHISIPLSLQGRGREPRSGGRVRGVQRRCDQLEHTRRIFQHLVVPEAQYPKALVLKTVIAPAVDDAVSVLRAVGLDDQSSFETSKIDDVGLSHMLPAEL